MSKELKALKEIKYLYNNMTTCETIRLKPHLEVIETELKALKIIKKKKVDTYVLRNSCDLEWYNIHKWGDCNNLTQKEYELLKEVL